MGECELGRAKTLCTIAQTFSRNFDTIVVRRRIKGGFMVETGKRAELSEAVWQAWIEKNTAQDRFRFERRLRVMGFVAVLGLVAVLTNIRPGRDYVSPTAAASPPPSPGTATRQTRSSGSPAGRGAPAQERLTVAGILVGTTRVRRCTRAGWPRC